MKKILGTILVAVAFAAVSTADAKQVRNAKQSTGAGPLFQAAKDAEQNPTPAAKANLVGTLDEQANTPAKQDTVDLKVEENKLVEGRKIVVERIKELKGWFGGLFSDKETKKALSAANDRLSDIDADLKKIRAQLKANVKETGSKWASALDYAIKTAKYIGIPVIVIGGVSYDLYYNKGANLMAGYEEVKAGMPRTRAAARRAYEAGKGYAGDIYEYGKTTGSNLYNKLPNMRRGTTMPTETSAERVGRVTSEYYNQ